MTNEASTEDLRHLRVGCTRGGLQGRAHPIPFSDGAREDPAQPALRNLRQAPTSAEHRNQACAPVGAPSLYQGIRRLTAVGQRGGDGAPRARTRATWGATAVLIGYLLFAPPVLLVGPLAGLLLLTRPARPREWLWLLGTGVWTILWLNQGGGLAAQFARAGAVLLIGTFLALTIWRPSAGFSRALAATGLAAAALTLWMWRLGVGWEEVRRAVENELWTYNQEVVVRLGTIRASGSAGQALLDQMSAMVRTIGAFYPALLFLAGLAGLSLAWSWYHRIVTRPLGPPPPAFSAFRFSDQLVWGWVAGLGLCLLPAEPLASSVGSNLLLVWSVLYATRGLAVFSAGSQQVPGLVIATLSLVAMFLLPFVVGGLTLLGLADTWLDFRRRLTTSAT
jgi:hypothetical protein